MSFIRRSIALTALFVAAACSIGDARETDDGSSPSHRRISPEQDALIARAQGTALAIVAYRNVSVFAATDEDSLVHSQTIVVDRDRIGAIVDTNNDQETIPDEADVIDGTGWYVVPGLIDSHVHFSDTAEPR